MTRRGFLASGAAAAAASAQTAKEDRISLAAWSLNRSFFRAGRWKNLDLPRICRDELGIAGLEFVNQFFENPTLRYLEQLKRAGADHGVSFVLIMIDHEGDMSARDLTERRAAAVAHRKWVDIAHYLGCHAVRCNMGGPRENWRQDRDLVARAAESFRSLLDYAADSGLNVVIENHGGASSDGDVLAGLMRAVDHPRFGTLPDFGNINRGDDHAEVIRKIVPWAKGISVKAAWTADGRNPGWDLEQLIRICRQAGYRGWWGIESSLTREGSREAKLDPGQIWNDELEGVRLTKAVLERTLLAGS